MSDLPSGVSITDVSAVGENTLGISVPASYEPDLDEIRFVISDTDVTDGSDEVTVTITYDTTGTNTGTSSVALVIFGGEYTSSPTFDVVDETNPSIDSVVVTSTDSNEDDVYVENETVQVTVTYDESVVVDSVSGTPVLSLGSEINALYSSANSTEIVFEYTVQDGDNADLAFGGISLNGSTIKDAAGNDAGLTASQLDGITASIDALDPSDPSSITIETSTPINAANDESVDFEVGFPSPPESGTVTLEITNGTKTENFSEEADTSDTITSFTGLDLSGFADGELSVMAKLADDAGNENAVGFTQKKLFVKDTVAPVVSNVTLKAVDGNSRVTVGDEIVVTANVSDANVVTSVTATATKFGVETVTLSDQNEDGVYEGSFQVAQQVTEGDYDVTVSASDEAGNSAESVDSESNLTVDTKDPWISSSYAHQSNGAVYVTLDASEALDASSITVSVNDSSDHELGTITSWSEIDNESHIYEGTYSIEQGKVPYSANLTAASDVAGNAVSDPVAGDVISVTSTIDVYAFADKVAVVVTADEELKSFDVDLKSAQDLAEFAQDDVIAAGVSLNQSQFDSSMNEERSVSTLDSKTRGAKYFYVYNYTVPRDGKFTATLSNAVAVAGSESPGEPTVDTDFATVDAKAPSVVDAEIVGADGVNTTISVQFDEPVSVGSQHPALKLYGHSLTVEDHDDSHNASGVVQVTVDGVVATGDAPSLSVTGGISELYGIDSSTKMSDVSTNGQVTESPVTETPVPESPVTETPVNASSSTTLDTHEYDLTKGVNFVSVPAEFGSLDIASSEFADTTIMTYDDGGWLTYNPEKPGDEQDFAELEGGQGYIVTTDADATVDVTVRNEKPGATAEDATPSAQHLEEGWNLVGHWQEGSQTQSQALGTISQSGSTNVWEQNAAGAYSYGVAGDFAPGHAYWVFVEDDEVYTTAEYRQIT